ncbi:MAG: DNA polymerase III subunit alpha [Candidatus Amoebophilus sp. 36-38]|nr:MAG: DNA polymerase III subunit alpha [Candidatus Amoebophilus sp. 36-38]
MTQFTHLHCHTQYSLLDGAAKINTLVSKAKQLGMQALAITDHGNMFGVPHFVAQAKKQAIKPIIGCEFYVASDMHDFKEKTRYHQLLLAKNEIGYQNISKLTSISYLEGYYYKPRIDKNLLRKYKEGLIATTCCLAGEVPQAILTKGEAAAEKIFLEWLELFGEDYYIELQRHGIKDQHKCNTVLLKWAQKYQVKVIATNDVHYVEQQDSLAQDILLCLQTGKDFNDPSRMRFDSDHFFLKSGEEMKNLFQDVPEAIINTQEIVDKIITPSLERDILLPIFQVPTGFTDQNVYLRHLAIEGAKKRYGLITADLENRINYELQVIQQMGFPGYFLIVQDFIQAAKNLKVVVGPGRGSIAGSVVAYCIGITNIDPIHYNLVFERFLNPERISMPDIDIDFDDEGRQKVIEYVVNKYGKNQVAHIITFGSMAAKSSIKDVARVLGLPLEKANYLTKLVPEKLGITLSEAFEEVLELAELRKNTDSLEGKVLALAETLEGSARHTGVHAAGIIIAPNDLLEYIPVKTDKNTDLLITQYDGSVVEQVGMLKMDFLGLKTLSIIKDTTELIEKLHGKKIDLETLPLDDQKTFELYQQGDTIATFQFESEGMRQWLKKLQPSHFEELIAMNALYRPGPMQFIPNFVARKHGQEKIEYPHPLLIDILKHTYGIMVYQEQVMQTAQIIAGYTLGEADLLRRAMGKKQVDEMAKQREVFIQRAKKKQGIDEKSAIEIFEMMEKFAQYGFNRAHAAAYSVIAYQTAYLKAHYPAEYMASVLTHNQNDIGKISFFMEECVRQGLQVLGPDINESQVNFDVNSNQQIRFGLTAIKGAGEAAVTHIIEEREKNGRFSDIFSFVERVDLKMVNKKTLESLVMAGALDGLTELHRKQYLFAPAAENNLIVKAIQYANQIKKEKATVQQSLFATDSEIYQYKKPEPPVCEPYDMLEKLKMEKEIVGFYISGHPLDPFKTELTYFCDCNTQNVLSFKQREARLGGIITECTIKINKQGRPFGLFTLEDYAGTLPLALFGEDFLKNQHMFQEGMFVHLSGVVVERYNQKDTWEFKPQKISLLGEVRDKLSKNLSIPIPIEKVNPAFVKELENLIIKTPGNCQLQLQIIDTIEAIEVILSVLQYRIHPSDEFLQKLTQLTETTYHFT